MLPWALGGLIAFTAANARAEVPPDAVAPSEQASPQNPSDDGKAAEAKARAATLFDEGVTLYARAEYARSAESFLLADALVPSSEALESAIAAARKAQAHLLVVSASDRAIARESDDPELAARARVALAEAERHLARVQVSCSPRPCMVFLDGRPLDVARLHLGPGSYRLSAQRGPSREISHADTVTEPFTALAGAEHIFALDAPARETTGASSSTSPTPERVNSEAAPRSHEGRAESRPGLPPWAFYGGLGVSGVLTVITAWSGFDALDQRAELPSRRDPGYEAARDDVYDAARRTDLLLGASVIVVAGTAALGTWWIDWGQGRSVELGTSPLPEGAELRLRGRFN